MIDVFTEEIEVIIKDGIANLYWYRGDLQKALLRSGVRPDLTRRLFSQSDAEGRTLSKRRIMDLLYEELRSEDFSKRLEISRNFVRILIERTSFVPQSDNHRVEVAERCALKLRESIRNQEADREHREQIARRAREAKKEDYYSQLASLRAEFVDASVLPVQQRGYALEKIFSKLMRISGIWVQESFSVAGEQIDGAVKYDGHYYVVELRWREKKSQPGDIGRFYFKVEGKMEARGIFVSMNGYTGGVESSVPRGKEVKVILLDGNHLTNVIEGLYTFQQLLEHAISNASVRGLIYCGHSLEQ